MNGTIRMVPVMARSDETTIDSPTILENMK